MRAIARVVLSCDEDTGYRFLGINMIGFTDIDGKNIAAVCEKTFHERLMVFLFLSSMTLFAICSMILTKPSRTREFQNACIDLIRGNYAGNKKELYFAGIQKYLS